jgi:hypothetical protein
MTRKNCREDGGNMSKKCAIHTQKLMGFLTMKGFVLQNIEEDKRNPDVNVYIFNDSEEIQKAIKEYRPFMDENKHWFIR